jgi:hypothetical protein
MSEHIDTSPDAQTEQRVGADRMATPSDPVCPICGGPVFLIHCERRCQRCHTLLEGCCEGERYIRILAETDEESDE